MIHGWGSCHHLLQCFIPLPVLSMQSLTNSQHSARFLKASWTRRSIVTESYGSALAAKGSAALCNLLYRSRACM